MGIANPSDVVGIHAFGGMTLVNHENTQIVTRNSSKLLKKQPINNNLSKNHVHLPTNNINLKRLYK